MESQLHLKPLPLTIGHLNLLKDYWAYEHGNNSSLLSKVLDIVVRVIKSMVYIDLDKKTYEYMVYINSFIRI